MPTLPRVGDQFGRYRIDGEIGRGGMGVVFAATDTEVVVGRRVALKVVSVALGDPAQEQEFLRRFEREAAVLARLDSPHVIAIYDYGSHDGCPYIATQYVGGGDLGALLHRRGPMPPTLALRVCAQVADALHDAHRVGVVHRDVKPTNVLLREGGGSGADLHAYLCDFGIARSASAEDGITRAGAVAGTWGYLAPECGRGAPGTPASDVYALGCLLWASLTGAPPYRGSDVEVAVAHQQAPVPQLGRPDPLSQQVDEVLRRCLAKDPAARWTDADQARAALAAAAALPDPGPLVGGPPPPTPPTFVPDTLPPPPPGPPGPPRPPTPTPLQPAPAPAGRRRRTTSVAVLACAAVAAVSVGAWAATRGAESPEPGPAAPSPAPSSGAPAPPAPTTSAPPPGPTRVDQEGPITGDLDGDGLGDLQVDYFHAVPTRGGGERSLTDLTTWRSDGRRLVQEGPAVPEEDGSRRRYDETVLGDFDGDDLLEEVVVSTIREEGRLLVSGDLTGGGELEGEVRIPTRPYTYPAPADVDGDGADDLVLQYYTGEFEEGPTAFGGVVLREGRPQPVVDLLSVPYSFEVSTYEVGDFDGDGRADLAVVHEPGSPDPTRNPQELTVWLGTGRGMVRTPTVTFGGGFSVEYIAADIDGDDDDELVQADGYDGTLRAVDVRDGRARAPRSVGAFRLPGDDTLAFGAIDVDGDGRDDIAGIREADRRLTQVFVAVSDGRRLVPRRFASWRRDFETGSEQSFSYFNVTTRSW